MTMRKTLLAGAAVLALTACGKKEETVPPQESADACAASSLGGDFRLDDASPLDVDALFALIPEDVRPTYDTTFFDKKIGATVITNLQLVEDGDEGALIARAEFYGVDLEAFERAKNAENAPADAPFETLFRKIRIFDIQSAGGEDEAERVTVGAAEIDTLRVRQGGVTDGAEDAENDELARLLNSFDLAGLYFKNVEVSGSESGTGAIGFSAEDLCIAGVGGGRFDSIVGAGIEYEVAQTEESRQAMKELMGPQGTLFLEGPLKLLLAPDKQRTTIKSFAWNGIDFSGLVAYGVKGEKPPMSATDLMSLGELSIKDMQTFINGKLAAEAEEGTVTAKQFTWLIPNEVTAVTKGMVYDFSAYVPETEEAALDVMRKRGLDNVTGDALAEWKWDSAQGDASFTYDFQMHDVMDYAMGLSVGGFKIDAIASAIETDDPTALSEAAVFYSFSVALKDEKFLDAAFDIAALQMGGTGDDLRQSVPAMIRLSGAQLGEFNPRVPGYVEAVAAFVADGGSLEISARPDEPASLLAIAAASQTAPQTLPDLLNLEVAHKE